MGEVYKGIELKLKAYGNNVEKLFTVNPDSNPEAIKLGLCGATALRVNEDGQLEAETELGHVKFTKPVAYQEIDGKRVEVAVEYRIQGSGIEGTESRGAGAQGGRGSLETQNSKPETRNSKLTYSFKVASYDKTKDLIIDPLLASTFLGGSADDVGASIALDASGNVYVTGMTSSTDFPTTSGAYDTSFNGNPLFGDVFVSKLNNELTSLLASTYLGGTYGDYGNALTLDTSGNVYVTGQTFSSNFPTTSGAYQTSNKGDNDVFVSKLNSGLTSLLASTYLGGSMDDYGKSLTLDTSGNVYVAGQTSSSNFPATSGAYQTANKGGNDVFVSKLNGGLTTLLASTYLGGSDYDAGFSLALDTSGNAYVTGWTFSADFPVTSGAYDTSFNGADDVFVSKLNGGLTNLLASTYLGGSGEEWGSSIALNDTSTSVYVTGTTSSADFPTTSGVIDTTYNGGWDIILSKLSTGLTSLLASSYLGGSGWDFGNALAVGKSGNVYVAGSTNSTDFSAISGGDVDEVFVGRFDDFVKYCDRFQGKGPSGFVQAIYIGPVYFTPYGSGKSDSMSTSNEYIYTTGNTSSPDFQTTSGAYDTSYNGGKDGFVQKLSVDSSCTYSISPTSQSFSSGGGTGSVGVTASSGSCSWTATSSESWITITSGSSGTGNGTVAYSVSANTSTSPRTGTMTIAGQTFTVTQEAISPPTVITGPATSVTKTSAKLNGTVNPEGLTTTAWFEYGKKSGSYTKKSKKKLNLTGTADVPVSFTVFKLTPGRKYYYRLAAENDAGASYGSELTFTTLSK